MYKRLGAPPDPRRELNITIVYLVSHAPATPIYLVRLVRSIFLFFFFFPRRRLLHCMAFTAGSRHAGTTQASKWESPLQDGEGDDQMSAVIRQLDGMRIGDAVQGKELYNFFGRRVIERTNSKGDVLAVKATAVDRSEGDMMHYAATHGVRAPRVHGAYDVVTTRLLTSAMVSGTSPVCRWKTSGRSLSAAGRAEVTDQLRDQLSRMRANTQPFIGRVGRRPTRNVYNPLSLSYCGPFADEEAL